MKSSFTTKNGKELGEDAFQNEIEKTHDPHFTLEIPQEYQCYNNLNRTVVSLRISFVPPRWENSFLG